ncbi:MAG: Na/Pi symporter, partial [Lachnospiraceae bacterium]|nr:Na/Pi symporter [Lachnospiraceae bacterium]
MSIFNVLAMISGIAFLLFGMHVMNEGLTKASGGKLEQILEKLTSNKLYAVLLGAGVTAIIQSSAATTVMVVGFVNSGIMKLTQAIGVIMGANVGTTITAWILSMTGIQGDNFWIQMLKPESFSPILALAGIILLMFSKKEKHHNVGNILLGFSVLMFGMSTMSQAVAPLADIPEFRNVLAQFNNPFLGVIAGTLLTAVIQSSSASVGILQALCVTGMVDYRMAIPISMGQNIGTCITALLSSVGANKNAKRA